MNARRIHRANPKTAAARAKEIAVREAFQAEKPSLAQLIRKGDVEAEDVLGMGQYFDLCEALAALKGEREKRGLTIATIAAASGLDRALISRLENGKIDNPTFATVTRYANAVGKRFLWSIRDSADAR